MAIKTKTHNGMDPVPSDITYPPNHKVCPFCGSLTQSQPWHGGKPTKVLLQCSDDGCPVQPMVTGETPEEAKEKWNTRSYT